MVELGKVTKWYRPSPPPPYTLIRTRDAKYIEYETGEKEFYDLRLDKSEMINCYGSQTQEQKIKFNRRLAQLQNEAKEKYRELEALDI